MIASVLQAICARDAAEVLKSERVVEVDGAGVIREDVKLELRKTVFPCLFNRNLDHCASKTESAVRCLNRNAKACAVLHLAVGADTLHPKVTDNRASWEGRDGEILWILHPCLQLTGKKRRVLRAFLRIPGHKGCLAGGDEAVCSEGAGIRGAGAAKGQRAAVRQGERLFLRFAWLSPQRRGR